MGSRMILVRAFSLTHRPSLRLNATIASRNLSLTSFKRSNVRPLDLGSEFVRDTILYQCNNLSQLRIYQIFAFANMMFWNYFGGFTLYKVVTYAKQAKERGVPAGGLSYSLGQLGQKYAVHLGAIAMVIGYGGLFLIGFFSTRVVNTIIIKKGGSDVVFLTSRYVAISKLREVKVPLKHISCKTSRDTASTYATVRIKGHPFYFLIDKKGVFYNPFLFDRTIGMYRNISKV